jgi:RIMS-binding protein 2
MIIGRDTHQLGPSAVRASNITSTSAVISWLPANSNHQHVVCVNNVEVRTVKPGVYRHTITGLAPNTQYRVTVRAKHHRSAQNVANLAEDLPMPAAAHTDFRTLPKGLPDPPSDILVEPGESTSLKYVLRATFIYFYLIRGINDTYPTHFEWDKNFLTARISLPHSVG